MIKYTCEKNALDKVFVFKIYADPEDKLTVKYACDAMAAGHAVEGVNRGRWERVQLKRSVGIVYGRKCSSCGIEHIGDRMPNYCDSCGARMANPSAEEEKQEVQSDAVVHPTHYNTGKIEVWDAIDDWGLGFGLGNVVKYTARAGHKGNKLEDLKKARNYLDREIRKLDGEG